MRGPDAEKPPDGVPAWVAFSPATESSWGPAVWSRAAPALWWAPRQAPAGSSRGGMRAVYAVRGRDK